MPFSLCDAPAIFQHLMQIVFNGIEWSGVLAYLDDIIIYGRKFGQHISILNSVLTRVEKIGLKPRPTKCCLLQKEIKFLERVASRIGIGCKSRKNGLYFEMGNSY